jgi:hypothetical protein
MTTFTQDAPRGNRQNALAKALQASASSPDELAAIAAGANVTPRQAALARAGKPINAGSYLALRGAVGVDPVDGAPRPPKTISANVVWWLLSAALYITRRIARA